MGSEIVWFRMLAHDITETITFPARVIRDLIEVGMGMRDAA